MTDGGGTLPTQTCPLDEATMRSVVVGNGNYKGWKTANVGDGQMRFYKKGDTIHVKEDRYDRDDWMMYCWRLAVAEIDRREAVQSHG